MLMTEHRIDTGNTPPVRLPPYHILNATAKVRKQLKQTEADGIIERSSSEWAAPIVLVKNDSILRMCVDYRCLNSLSHVDVYPMPQVNNLIDRLGNARHIHT
jgi:hypothetical protein